MTKPQIKTFLAKLEGKEGCNFREIKGKITWTCKSGRDQSLSEKILTDMKIPKVERVKFLKKCSELSGYCDCEILFNVANRLV